MSTLIETILEDHLRVKGISSLSQETFYTDASKDYGGLGEHFSPIDLLMGSLAACMLTLMGMRASKLGVNVEGTIIKVTKELTHKHHISKIIIEVSCPIPLDFYNASEPEKVALQCPIHNSLHPDIQKEHCFRWQKK